MVLHLVLEEKLNAALDLKAQGHAVSKDSVHALLGHLTDAYLLQAVPLHTASERQRNSNPRKIYPADPGLIHAFDASGRELLQVCADPSTVDARGQRPAGDARLRMDAEGEVMTVGMDSAAIATLETDVAGIPAAPAHIRDRATAANHALNAQTPAIPRPVWRHAWTP